MELLFELIAGKRVLILGFGAEGRSTYKYIKQTGAFSKLGIADVKPVSDLPGCVIHSGSGYLDNIENYDVVFKSPGIVLPKNYKDYSCIITSQTEVFLKAYGRQVIGITGTKGKSTVASLLYHVLYSNNIRCLFAGNIGIPVFDIAKDMSPGAAAVLELSCHQLEICGVSPAAAVLLNLYEDHLDHYGTYANYIKAKKNIYLHQQPSDILYCGENVKPARGESVSRTVVVNKDMLPFGSLKDVDGVRLRGEHNLVNCAFVYSIAKTFGITDDEFTAALKSYIPLRHRLEFIGNRNGVDYYDDSISTTVESTINAVETVQNISTLLLGGMDRGIDYSFLAEYLSKSGLSVIICMYESGKKIFEMLKSCEKMKPVCVLCENLPEAIKTAKKLTPPGTACVLSPAAASYGDFKDFKERGDMFKSMVFDDTAEG